MFVIGEWRIASREEFLSPIRYSLFAIRPLAYSAADQRLHMRDVLTADVISHRPDAGYTRHRVPAEEQVIAGTDQAGVEQHRIHASEFAGRNALLEQAALEIQQRRNEE